MWFKQFGRHIHRKKVLLKNKEALSVAVPALFNDYMNIQHLSMVFIIELEYTRW